MADIKLDELLAALGSLTASIDRTSAEFDEFGVRLTEEQLARRRSEQAIQAAQDARVKREKEFINAVGNSAKNLTQFAGNLANSSGSFSMYNSAIGGFADGVSSVGSKLGKFGQVVGKTAEVLGVVAKQTIDTLEKAYLSFQRVSDSGVVQTVTDLNNAIDNTGINFDRLERVLTKNSAELALLGGSAVAGRMQFEAVAKTSADVRRKFQRLGIDAEEFSNYQISSINMQRMLTRGQVKDVHQLNKGTADYIVNLDALSKLTGLSRKELNKELEDRMTISYYRAGIATLDNKARTEVDNTITVLQRFAGPEVSKGMMQFLSSGLMTGEAAKELNNILVAGGDSLENYRGLREGTMKMADAMPRLQESLRRATEVGNAPQQLSGMADIKNPFARMYVDAAKLGSAALPASLEQLKKESAATMNAPGGINKDLAEAKVSQEQSQLNMEKSFLAVGGFITPALSGLGKAAEYATGKLYGMVGGKSQAEGNQPAAGGGGGGGGGAVPTPRSRQGAPSRGAPRASPAAPAPSAPPAAPEVPSVKHSSQQPMNKSEPGEPPGTNTPGAQQGKEDRYSEADLIKMGLKIKQGDVQAPNQYLSPKLLSLAKSVQSGLPGFSVFSGFNDRYHHKLNYKSNHTRGIGMDFTLARPPSKEEGAKIVGILKGMGASMVIDEYNSRSGGWSGGHIHAEVPAAANGAIISPRTGGSLVQVAEAGQSEAIVPLPDGRSIPVIIKNSGDMSAGMGEAFMAMTARLDTMINLLASGNKYTRNIAQNIV